MIVIWGLIGYQIFSAIEAPDRPIQLAATTTVLAADDMELEKYNLLLSYTDPFNLSNSREYSVEENNQSGLVIQRNDKPITASAAQETTWPSITYGGMVKSSNAKQVGLLIINGKSYLIKKGEEYQGVKVLMYNEDEVKLRFSKAEKTIKK